MPILSTVSKIIGSSTVVPNPVTIFELLSLPFLRVYKHSPAFRYLVNDCEYAIDQMDEAISMHFPIKYWNATELYGETSYKTYHYEDVDTIKDVLKLSIDSVLVMELTAESAAMNED